MYRGHTTITYDGKNYNNEINIVNTKLTCNSPCSVRHHIVIFYHYSNYFYRFQEYYLNLIFAALRVPDEGFPETRHMEIVLDTVVDTSICKKRLHI
jgi:hypothetical protein